MTSSNVTRPSFPNPDRPIFWPGEENHFRSALQVGDIVRGQYGELARIVAFNNTWSHIRGGRLVHLEQVGPGYGHKSSWESDLTPGEPGDIGAHRQPGSWAGNWSHVSASWQGGRCECHPTPDWDGVLCSVCGEGFDAESWDLRHTDPDDELAEVHAECCTCDETDDLRQVASDWHGGQASALYAFSSTGTIVPGLEAEIRHCLREIGAGQYRSDEINVETPRLSALLDYVVSQTPGTIHELSPRSGLYGVTVQVEHTRDGWHGSYGLPYFQVQACSEADAVDTARCIVEGQTVGTRAVETRTFHITAVAL